MRAGSFGSGWSYDMLHHVDQEVTGSFKGSLFTVSYNVPCGNPTVTTKAWHSEWNEPFMLSVSEPEHSG